MYDVRELYQELIIDHSKKPRNFRPLADCDRSAQGFNPLCGDKVTIYLKVEDGIVRDASFQGSGCAISTASASLMTEVLKGKTPAEVEALFQSFHRLVTGDHQGTPNKPELG
ncbi:MAG: Fe-S cluster assembly sulfur transfer protein SufU, partial [Terriglobia bacterium]